jgi:hypothetical protein
MGLCGAELALLAWRFDELAHKRGRTNWGRRSTCTARPNHGESEASWTFRMTDGPCPLRSTRTVTFRDVESRGVRLALKPSNSAHALGERRESYRPCESVYRVVDDE